MAKFSPGNIIEWAHGSGYVLVLSEERYTYIKDSTGYGFHNPPGSTDEHFHLVTDIFQEEFKKSI